jgi:hypothetical protein
MMRARQQKVKQILVLFAGAGHRPLSEPVQLSFLDDPVTKQAVELKGIRLHGPG